jgi:hypothetical protein
MNPDSSLLCCVALGFYTLPLSAGFLNLTIAQMKGRRKWVSFWLALIGTIALESLLYFLMVAASNSFHGNFPDQVVTVALGVTIFIGALSPLMLIIALILRVRHRDRFKPPPPYIPQPPTAVLEARERRVEAAQEVLEAPRGVKVSFKLSRTIQHTISVDWKASGDITADATLAQLVKLTIHSTIERSKETSYQESETREYNVELDGAASSAYKLIWTDVWQQGRVDLETKSGKHCVPFEYRDRTELKVVPIAPG